MGTRRVATIAAVAGGLLSLFASKAHANGLVALEGAIDLGLMGAVLLAPVVATEAIAYRVLLGATWLRSWLSALVANVVGAPFMAVAVFCLAWARFDWPSRPYAPQEVGGEALVALACVAGLISAKLGIVWAMNRKGPAKRPVWKVALGMSALTTALVVGVCMACYDLG